MRIESKKSIKQQFFPKLYIEQDFNRMKKCIFFAILGFPETVNA